MPLAILLGAERAAAGSAGAPDAPTIAWEGDADVAIGFAPRYEERREWTGGAPGAPGANVPYAEHHRGVFLNIARGAAAAAA